MTQVSLNFDTKQLRAIERKFADTIERDIPLAARRALEDGQKKARTEIVRNLKPIYNPRAVKRKEIVSSIDKNTRKMLATDDINKMSILMVMPRKSFGLLRFVQGRKSPRKQKGVKIKDRKNLKVRIKPGEVKQLQHAFIAKGKGRRKEGGTNYQVFRRTKEGKLRRMATPSIATYAEKFLSRKVEPEVAKKMERSFTRNLRALSKLF